MDWSMERAAELVRGLIRGLAVTVFAVGRGVALFGEGTLRLGHGLVRLAYWIREREP